MKLTNTQNKAFTLVELIVVITILAILGTISFISFRGYSKNARDSVRLRDIKTIESSLELYQVKVGNYPEPTDIVSVTFSGATVWDQGTFGTQTFTNVGKLNKLPKDPLTEIEYTYSLLNTKNQYELASIMENDITAYNVIPETNAADKKTNLTIIGNYNGQIAKVSTGSTTYILAVPSLITSSTGSLDLSDIVTNNNLAYKGYSNLPRNYTNTAYELTGETTPLNLVNSGNLVIYSSGSLSDLTNTDTGARLSMLQNLQDAYSGTELENNTNFSQLLSISEFTDTNTQATNLVAGIVNNYLGGEIGLSQSIPSTPSTPSSSNQYVEDVFNTYLYTGNGGTQTIENGIDLENEGGMVWTKPRSVTDNHNLFDTERGYNKKLMCNTTAAEGTTQLPYDLNSFNVDGFTLGDSWGANINTSGVDYASWTFRKAPNFFDIVTYTGDGVTGREIAHDLGVEPGMIMIKALDESYNRRVYHRALGGTQFLEINTTDTAQTQLNAWNNTNANTNNFTLGTDSYLNANGTSYVAYIFAHDSSGDGMIQCDDYMGNGSINGPEIDLGWEPQWLIIKSSSQSSSWTMFDNMRGISTNGIDKILSANESTDESEVEYLNLLSNGFKLVSAGATRVNASGQNYIYCAIRAPMKIPTSSSDVFTVDMPLVATTPNFTSNFPVDMALTRFNNNTDLNTVMTSRLTYGKYMFTSIAGEDALSGAPISSSSFYYDYNNGIVKHGLGLGDDISWMWKRAPGFFDVVTYMGDGIGGKTVNHNLAVEPEMIWIKSRTSSYDWQVYHSSVGLTKWAYLNKINAFGSSNSPGFNNLTSNSFDIGTYTAVNGTNSNYISYLFATLPGISKVGSYTGDGINGKVIDAGFSSGAKYIMIKRTDSTGDWLLWDSERGIIEGNDPHISLNTNAAEVTSDDSVDPNNSGFVVNQNGTTNINVSGGEYIYYSISK